MAQARTGRGRLKQVELWLKKEFITPHKTKVRVRKFARSESWLAHSIRVSKVVWIEISDSMPTWLQIDTLLHEWAHAVTYKHDKLEKVTPEHSDEWGLTYAKIYRKYHDEEGKKESRKYNPKPWS